MTSPTSFFSRLSGISTGISAKFTLVGLGFIVPIGVLIYFLVREQAVSIDFAEKERQGILYLRSLRGVMEKLPQHQSLLLRLVRTADADRADTPALRDTLGLLAKGILQHLDTLRAAGGASERRDGDIDISEPLRLLRFTWLDLDNLTQRIAGDNFTQRIAGGNFTQRVAGGNFSQRIAGGNFSQRIAGGNDREGVEFVLSKYENFYTILFEMVSVIGNKSNLILDPDIDSYYTMDAVVLKLPKIFYFTSRLQTLSESSLSDAAAPPRSAGVALPRSADGTPLRSADGTLPLSADGTLPLSADGTLPLSADGTPLLSAERRAALLSTANLLRFNLDAMRTALQKEAFSANPSGTLEPQLDAPLFLAVSETDRFAALIETGMQATDLLGQTPASIGTANALKRPPVAAVRRPLSPDDVSTGARNALAASFMLWDKSIAALDELLAARIAGFQRQRLFSLTVVALVTAATLLFGVLIARRLIGQVRTLSRVATAISSGNMMFYKVLSEQDAARYTAPPGETVLVASGDEIGELALAFASMEVTLRQNITELESASEAIRSANQTLEERVALRTSELEQRTAELEMRRTESEMRRTELEQRRVESELRRTELELKNRDFAEALVELDARSEKIRLQADDLEMLDRIVQTINLEALEFHALVDMLLRQSFHLLPAAETGTFLYLDETANVFRFEAASGYDLEFLQHITFTPEEVAARYFESGERLSKGVSLVRASDNLPASDKMRAVQTAVAMLAVAITINDRLEGLLILESSVDEDAFDSSDLSRLARFREHAISAVAKAKALQEAKAANEALMKSQQNVVMQEKMASLGQLTAGIAHEINNPINFVAGGVKVLERDLIDVMDVLKKYDDLLLKSGLSEAVVLMEKYKDGIDFDTTVAELQTTLKGIAEGAKRTADIVKGLRNFSRLDENDLKQVDLHEGLESTLLLLTSEIKGKVEVVKRYGALQPVECYPGQLNQVFMNMLTNALQALVPDRKGEIVITTESVGEMTAEPVGEPDATGSGGRRVRIRIADNGAGMSEATKQKIFDPFFTTKDVGKGTGLGLSISFGIIQKHHGTIEVHSELGKGTAFILSLPVRQPHSKSS